jgi:tRNA/rRNA methyltransferase
MVKSIVTARYAAEQARQQVMGGAKVGFLFGPERTGLINDDLSLADTLLTVPLNPDFTSLNLGQAVLLVGYEWYQAGDQTPGSVLDLSGGIPASRDQLVNFFVHLERELDACGFLRNAEARPHMIRNLRNMWHRANLTEQEIRTLHGVVKELATSRQARKPAAGG